MVYKAVFHAEAERGFRHGKKIMFFSDRRMDRLVEELKGKVITLLNLPDLSPESFDPDARLVGGDFGIDSIDVLELVVMVEKDYGVLINNQEVGQQVFSSLRTLADHIRRHSPQSLS